MIGRRRWMFTAAACLALAPAAQAGGLLLPGSGAVSTSRAGAAIASTDDGEAIGINPAGLAKAGSGTVLTISVTAIDYIMSFARRGVYPTVNDDGMGTAYAGQPYPVMKNQANPNFGIGPLQPVPVVALVSDVGGAVRGLHIAFGLWAPNAYPARNMTNVNGQPWSFDANHFDAPPPPTRYDILTQQAAVILPTLAASYRILPGLDIGGRFSSGVASIQSQVALWGVPLNYSQFIKEDGLFSVNAKDPFVPAWALGATYRPTPNLEFAVNYTAEIDVNAQGTAQSVNGPAVTLGTATPVVVPVPNGPNIRCAPNGTAQNIETCVDFAIPQTAQVGGRWKFLDGDGRLRGDIELDLDWENWGTSAASNYSVVVDGEVVTTQNPNPADGIYLQNQLIRHGFQDTYAARLGGSYVIPVGTGHHDEVTLRGGIGYDTAAATTGWERVDIDGAARTDIAAGASYQTGKTRFDLGFGFIYEGSVNNSSTCLPTQQNPGCAGTGMDQPEPQRQGPDPISPIVTANSQAQDPVNEGIYKAHYLEFMLGMTTRF
jgi:long-subunit fatty acid transport protein